MAIVTNAYEQITSQTLGSDTAGMTFNSFSGYTHLRIVLHGGITSNLWATRMQLNNDSGSNYSDIRLVSYQPSQYNPEYSVTTATNQIYIIGAGQAQNSLANLGIVDLMDYSNTSKHKLVLSRWSGTSGAERTGAFGVFRWKNVSAISSIYIYDPVSGLKAGTTVSLYGIKAAT